MQGWKVLERGLRWRVGDGWSIRVKQDPWIPRPYTFRVKLTHSEMPLMVGDLIDSELGSWNSTLVRTCFEEEENTMIMGLLISVARCKDRIIWHYSTNGAYSVRMGYGVAMEMQANGLLGRKGTGGCSRRELLWRCRLMGCWGERVRGDVVEGMRVIIVGGIYRT
ncbi:hypothetical protein ACFX2G_028830 [Malus domestica]